MRALYAAAAGLARLAAHFVPTGNSKAAISLRARRGISDRYRRWAEEHRDAGRPLLWIHAPSVGEGLQARPVISLLRARHPELQLAYTFFSPSAEEFSRGLDVDFRDYLPFDTAADMRAALDALRPRALVFSKLDVWPELVRQARRRDVHIGVISATLAAASGRRSRIASRLLRDAYGSLHAVGAVDQADARRLESLGVRGEVIEITGDTRFDQVWHRAKSVDRGSALLARLAANRPTIVAGSTWPSDEVHLLDAFAAARERVGTRDPRLVIAQHEPTRAHQAPLERWAANRQLPCARLDDAAAAGADVVIVDRMGVLGELYALADVAFVGGGFHDAGLHSVLEPAAFGVPVIFGPKHTRSRDALLLLERGAARAVTGTGELRDVLVSWFEDGEARRQAGESARRVVEEGLGAAERSVNLIERLL